MTIEMVKNALKLGQSSRQSTTNDAVQLYSVPHIHPFILVEGSFCNVFQSIDYLFAIIIIIYPIRFYCVHGGGAQIHEQGGKVS